MFIAGNSDDAKKKVTGILKDFGWGVVDVGGIESVFRTLGISFDPIRNDPTLWTITPDARDKPIWRRRKTR